MIFFALLLLSVVSWVLLLQRAYVTRRVRRLARLYEAAMLSQGGELLSLDMNRLPQPASGSSSHPLQEIYLSLRKKAVQLIEKNLYFAEQEKGAKPAPFLTAEDLELLESHVLTTVSQEGRQLERHLFLLPMITALAPFLGLLGTVWGILVTFAGMHSGAAATSNMVVLAGLSTALSTTVMGLLIAIPALVGFAFLKNSQRHLGSELEEFLYKLLSQLEMSYRR